MNVTSRALKLNLKNCLSDTNSVEDDLAVAAEESRLRSFGSLSVESCSFGDQEQEGQSSEGGSSRYTASQRLACRSTSISLDSYEFENDEEFLND